MHWWLSELCLLFSQGGKKSHSNRRTCQTRTDLRLLIEEMVTGLRGADWNKLFLETDGCVADTQSTMQLYQRAQRLPATSPFPEKLVFPSLNNNNELIWLPRSESLTRCWARIQLRTKCTFCLAWEKAESSWKLFHGWKNTTKNMITISFLFRANEYTCKGLDKNSSSVQFLKTEMYDSFFFFFF